MSTRLTKETGDDDDDDDDDRIIALRAVKLWHDSTTLYCVTNRM